ncbi:MAG: SDR family NAD(P)-dependent oxidoreductase [Actinomycetes bacterium]
MAPPLNPLTVARSVGGKVVDGLLEVGVVGSFTRIGFDVRSRLGDWSLLPDMTGKTIVITGATSGLGQAAARQLANLNADLIIIGRDLERTERAAQQLQLLGTGSAKALVADMSELSEVREVSDRLNESDRIDALLHNAGALSDTYTVTSDGFETTYACHVLGPFLMTHLVLDRLATTPAARVITMTSGGMYSEKLTPEAVEMDAQDYLGVTAYARAKRAQVVLTEQWAQRFGILAHFHTVHPGWADTPGVEQSLPKFHSVVGPLLRTPEQGADTMVWLAATPAAVESNGRLWLDRVQRQTNKVPWTVTGQSEAKALWDRVRTDADC